jgi:hypothetical protein
MQAKLISRIGLLLWLGLLFSNTLLARQEKTPQKTFTDAELRKMDKGKMRPPHGTTFQLNAMELNKGMYLAFLADENNRTMQEFFLYDKLAILEAVVSEAKKFGPTEESVGGSKPLTTRFMDKQVPNFIIDVAKLGKTTSYYLTLKGQTGSLTVSAGSFKRGDPETPRLMIDDILERVQAAKEHAASIQ